MAVWARALPARQTDHGLTWEITASPDLDPLRVVGSLDDALDGIRAELQPGRSPERVPAPEGRLVHHPEGDIVMVSANHAAFDGFGTLRVLQPISRAYAGDADPAPPSPWMRPETSRLIWAPTVRSFGPGAGGHWPARPSTSWPAAPASAPSGRRSAPDTGSTIAACPCLPLPGTPP
ncbi:MAG: hypothetical protein ACR2MO_02955 [Acidimicrobiales bacterium]